MSDEKNMEAIMEVYKKLAVPGPAHKQLASRAGSWSTRNRHWMEPDKPPMESTGACERKMIIEGRYLQEELTGEMMGVRLPASALPGSTTIPRSMRWFGWIP